VSCFLEKDALGGSELSNPRTQGKLAVILTSVRVRPSLSSGISGTNSSLCEHIQIAATNLRKAKTDQQNVLTMN